MTQAPGGSDPLAQGRRAVAQRGAVLPPLLLITALALLLPLIGQAPQLVSLAGAQLPTEARRQPPAAPVGIGSPAVLDSVPAAVEPGAGPAVGPAAPMPEPPAATSAGLGGPSSVEALEAFAAELGRHRAKLEAREQAIGLREATVKLVEERVREQVARLESLTGELERLLGQASADDQARIAQLVKVYEAMKAKNAAMIFEPMGLELLLPIVRGMRDTKIAAIVAEMDPAKARALTAELARAQEPPAPR